MTDTLKSFIKEEMSQSEQVKVGKILDWVNTIKKSNLDTRHSALSIGLIAIKYKSELEQFDRECSTLKESDLIEEILKMAHITI